MEQTLRKPGFGERLKQLAYLLKHTFTIVGRDRDIISPVIRTIVMSAIVVTLFFAMITAYVVDANGWGTLLLLMWMVLGIYHFFYFNRQELALSWMVFETAAGRDRSLPDAAERVGGLRSQVRWLAILDMAARARAGQEHGQRIETLPTWDDHFNLVLSNV